jgi:hypothetical protein
MLLKAEERFALRMLFRGSDATSVAVRAQLETSQVVDRKETGVGFFTSIRLTAPLPITTQHQWDWNFEHCHLSHGGSFMCWISDASLLELEAVAHNGVWPDSFDPDDFRET